MGTKVELSHPVQKDSLSGVQVLMVHDIWLATWVSFSGTPRPPKRWLSFWLSLKAIHKWGTNSKKDEPPTWMFKTRFPSILTKRVAFLWFSLSARSPPAHQKRVRAWRMREEGGLPHPPTQVLVNPSACDLFRKGHRVVQGFQKSHQTSKMIDPKHAKHPQRQQCL